MPKGSQKFELTLSLQEIVVLFLVMVALFTGLLIFGYRVGNANSTKAIEQPPSTVAPAQETPETQPRRPAGAPPPEPEIRLENAAPEKSDDPLLGPETPSDPDEENRRPLAQAQEIPQPAEDNRHQVRETSQHPCEADNYWSFLQKSVSSKHRFFGRLADWAGAPRLDATPEAGQSSVVTSAADSMFDSGPLQSTDEGTEVTGCSPPLPRLVASSVAC